MKLNSLGLKKAQSLKSQDTPKEIKSKNASFATIYAHQPSVKLEQLPLISVSKLRTKMYQNTCVDFKLGYEDAKSDAIAFCVKPYPSGSFIKNRSNMHEMQNRMEIAFCVKPPLPFILLAVKGGPHVKFLKGGLSWPRAGTSAIFR